MMDQIIVNVSGLHPDEKQAVNKALAKITGCKELECQSAKAIFFYAPCPAIPNTISWDYDQHENKPTHTPQEIIAMAEQLNTKRKVRADFDKSQPITVNVSGCSEDVKKQVQQAFFDVGIKWRGKECTTQYLHASTYGATSSMLSENNSIVMFYSNQTLDSSITPAEFFSMVYEDEAQGHPHAELMMEYAEDAKTHAEPWKLWQLKNKKQLVWSDCTSNPNWDIDLQYRRKPKTHLVHGVEVPDLRINPSRGENCYYPLPTSPNLVRQTIFIPGDDGDKYILRNNLCYEYTEAGKQAAILHSKAWLGIA